MRSWGRATGRVGAVLLMLALPCAGRAQVFTVGERSATADMKVDFKPTHVELPDGQLSQRGRRELVRDLQAEQGFAHRILPLGAVLTLQANGNLTPRDDQYKQMVYKKGQSAAPGDRIVVTALEFKGDRILIDLNGGPYVKHRFLRHIQIGVGGVQTQEPDLSEQATGCRITLVFEGGIPEISAPEVKALLEPVVDFGVKTGDQAYADTLPTPIKSAIAAHEVLVGMNRRMVMAALGQPESKMREGAPGERYEEWIYGHQPQTMRFVRFFGDRVTMIKVAALGRAIEIHDHDEMAGYNPPGAILALGDGGKPEKNAGPPSLRLPDEAQVPVTTEGQVNRKVQYPDERAKPLPRAPEAPDMTAPRMAPPGPSAAPGRPPSV